jgi:acid phosphatase type 7
MPLRLGALLAAAAVALTAAPARAQTPTPTPTPTRTPTATPTPTPAPPSDPVIGAAGDIACDPADANFNGGEGTPGHCQQKATSDLLVKAKPSLTAVLPLGDTQYEEGILSTYALSYNPTWGRLKAISHPAVGNHEYFGGAGDGAGYFDYFDGIGAQTGPAGQRGSDYYSYDIGAWHLIVLDSVCSRVGGCGPGSPQETWLRADLAAHPNACTLAYWHHPRFTSTGIGWTSMDTIWQDLYDAGVDVVLNGHIHHYERFAPQTPAGALDPSYGVREFIVGTGGKSQQGFPATRLPTSEAAASGFGVLFLTLHPGSYDWSFTPIDRGGFRDSGSYPCHGAPPPRPATAATGDAFATGKTSARITGALDTGNQPTTYHFDYGTSIFYGASTPDAYAPGPADGTRQVAVRLTHLKKNRVYHYRLVANNASGVVFGPDRTLRAGKRTSYPAAIARTKGLLAYWRLDESGFAFDDKGDSLAVGSGNIPQVEGALVGDRSLASAFDGATASIEADGPVVTHSATIEGWFRWTAGDVILRDDSSAGGWLIGKSGSKLGYRVAGRVYRTTRAIERVRDGAWHYIAVTKSGSSVAIYVDGRRVHRGSGASDAPPTMPWHIMRNGPFEDHAAGLADEVAIYNRRLSRKTLVAHYRDGVRRHPPATRVKGPDGPTNDAAPTFRLRGGSAVRCSLYGPGTRRTLTGCASVSNFGQLADGHYTLTAYAIDDSGHPDPSPVHRRFVVDTVTPTLGLTAPDKVPSGLRRSGLPLRATCSEACTVVARLSVAAGAASRLHLGHGRAVLGSTEIKIGGAGTKPLRIRLTDRVRKRLKHRHVLAATLHVVATDRAGNARAERRELTAG